MLLERNDNKRIAEVPATKHHIITKNVKKPQKENKVPLNNPYTPTMAQKQSFETVIEDPIKNLLITETNKIKSMNLKKILAFELSKSKGNYRSDFLQKHKFSADIRTRMVK